MSAGDGGYVRAVEAAWSRLRGRPVVLSPRDFEIVDGWRRRGIPLTVVLEVFEQRAKRSRGGGRSLAWMSGSIEDAWETVRGGRAARATPEARMPGGTAAWAQAIAALPHGSPLRAFLSGLAQDAAAGVCADILDARLDAELPELVSREDRVRAESATDAALAPFRSRMPPHELARTRARAIADRLRATLSLPRLSSSG